MAKDDAKGNQNYLHPEFWKPMVDYVNGTIVERNTAYGDASGGVRDNAESHLKLLEEHGWNKYFKVDLMDAEGPDVVWPAEGGKVLKTNAIGKNIFNYDSMLVLAHFRAIRWMDTAGPSSSFPSAAPPAPGRPSFIPPGLATTVTNAAKSTLPISSSPRPWPMPL